MESKNTFTLAGKVRAVKDFDSAEATVNLIVTYDSALKECDIGSFFIKTAPRLIEDVYDGDTVEIHGHLELKREWKTDVFGNKKPGRSRLVLRADNIIRL